MWWLFSSLARYPKEIFVGRAAEAMGIVFTFVLPILLVVNVPAAVMVRVLEPGMLTWWQRPLHSGRATGFSGRFGLTGARVAESVALGRSRH